MAKKKNKKTKPLKASSFDIANYGVTKAPIAKGGTSSTAFTGETVDWSKVDFGKSVMSDLMKNRENFRKEVQSKKDAKEESTTPSPNGTETPEPTDEIKKQLEDCTKIVCKQAVGNLLC